jgi:signal transduction histidine kinase
MAIDLAICLTVAVVSVAGLLTQHRLTTLAIVFCVALCAPLPLRRASPMLCFAAVATVALAQWLLAAPQLADAAVLISLYWVTLDGSPIAAAIAAGIVAVGAIMAALRWSPSEPLKVWVGLTGLATAAGVLGVSVRQRRALLASLQERAARLEFERDQEGRIGAAAERARIAREMHDIVAHNLSVMIALADGATYAMDTSPERAAEATQRIAATGREALVEMRRLLGVLRDRSSAQPLEPQPSLDRLDELLARVHAAGIPVTMDLEGDPHGLADGVQLTVFRVAQEALTNTLKHAARPTRAHLALSCRPGQVELEVIDTGEGRTGEGWTGEGRVGEGRADEGRAGEGQAGEGRAGGGRAGGGRAGEGQADEGRTGGCRAGEGQADEGRTGGGRAGASRSAVAPDGRGLHGMRERAASYGGTLEAGPGPRGGWRVRLLLNPDAQAASR